jgi:uncharacterized protein (DUF924 family)
LQDYSYHFLLSEIAEMRVQQKVINFWFNELIPKQWWQKNPLIDEHIRKNFGKLHQKASLGELWSWRNTAEGCLAEIIILDQFSRNIYRENPKSFYYDGMALALAQGAIQNQVNHELTSTKKRFLYMPFMHSESKKIHEIAMQLFAEPGLKLSLKHEIKHKIIIDRFGRFPNRNAILGRISTPKELEFLKKIS